MRKRNVLVCIVHDVANTLYILKICDDVLPLLKPGRSANTAGPNKLDRTVSSTWLEPLAWCGRFYATASDFLWKSCSPLDTSVYKHIMYYSQGLGGGWENRLARSDKQFILSYAMVLNVSESATRLPFGRLGGFLKLVKASVGKNLQHFPDDALCTSNSTLEHRL